MRDKYNLNTLPAGAAGMDDHEIGTSTSPTKILTLKDKIFEYLF